MEKIKVILAAEESQNLRSMDQNRTGDQTTFSGSLLPIEFASQAGFERELFNNFDTKTPVTSDLEL